MITGDFNVQISARVSELHDLYAMVETFGEAQELPNRTVFIINLALEELVTNTLVHGTFDDGIEPEINIGLSINNDRVIVVVRSNGGEFDPTQDSNVDTTSELENRPIGGLGLHLIKAQADDYSYEFVDGINLLTLEYNIS
ncbi:MAG: ATP-binding protein [Bacteroidetes bacterium]|nr:ATP-binding protein [Bacteroidota bacterium]MCY4234658.1 ATP-binding protein [Bacteroidota bacterium]